MSTMVSSESLKQFWDVLVLFLIPWGGGIPSGVLLAQKFGLHWSVMSVLYLISDIILAFMFEPIVLFFGWLGRRSARMSLFLSKMQESTLKSAGRFGLNPKPFTIVVISFGIDPMTGRTAAKATGHGFVSGWSLVILGDMFFFGLIMSSTIFLNNILGDGTLTAVIITLAVLFFPALIEKTKKRFAKL